MILDKIYININNIILYNFLKGFDYNDKNGI